MIALVVRRGPADLIPVLAAGRLPVPVAAVVLGQPEAIRLLPGDGTGPGGGSVPAYAYPEAAARALARAARYGSWRSRQAGTVPELANLRVADAQSIIDSFLARMPGGGSLPAGEADDLLRCYGIPMVEFRRVGDADAAVGAAARLGGHVVIKADVPGLLHQTNAGAVELDLHGADEVRAAMGRLQARFAGRMSGVLVEPMVAGGVEAVVGVIRNPIRPGRRIRARRGRRDVLSDRAARSPRSPVPTPTT